MKKYFCTILAVLILLPVFATTAFASGHGKAHGRQVQTAPQKCTNHETCVQQKDGVNQKNCTSDCSYADTNNDQICDNCLNRCTQCEKNQDENRDGICDHCGKCSHYGDENSNGICDHQENCEKQKKASCNHSVRKSRHHGSHSGKHH